MKIDDIVADYKEHGRAAFCWSKEDPEEYRSYLSFDWGCREALIVYRKKSYAWRPFINFYTSLDVLLPEKVDAKALVGWLKDPDIQKLLDRVCDGLSVETTGTSCVIDFSEDAKDAESMLDFFHMEELSTGGWIPAEEWIRPARYELGITAHTSDGALMEIAKDSLSVAERRNFTFNLQNGFEYLKGVRDELQDAELQHHLNCTGEG
jgi:hypothetical protein